MIYFDYASTTPVRAEVLEAYEKILHTYYANADSLHQEGRKVHTQMCIRDRSRWASMC